MKAETPVGHIPQPADPDTADVRLVGGSPLPSFTCTGELHNVVLEIATSPTDNLVENTLSTNRTTCQVVAMIRQLASL